MLFYVSLGLNIALFSLLCGSIFLLHRAGSAINDYEEFYEETVKSLEKHLIFVSELMRNNVILQGDESVRRVFSAIKSFYEMLIGFHNAGRRQPTQDRQELL